MKDTKVNKKIKTHLNKIGKHLQKHKIVPTFGIIIFLILFFDKLFILTIFTLLVQFKKVILFFKNKIINLLPIIR
jgi:hypothetical protein